MLWRHSRKHGVQVALVHRPRYDDWSLPKGKALPHETAPVTAAREVWEETGFTAALGRSLTSVSYSVSHRAKTVHYFSARAVDGSFEPNREVDGLEWFTMGAARKRMTYDFDRAVLDTFAIHPADAATLVLVRHARAGVRESWEGSDAERPLDAKGLRQAEALVPLLAAFGPRSVHSASVERCRGTLLPLADSLDLEIVDEPALTEDAYRHDPAAARKRIVALADRERPVAVCSQGGVIPGVVKSLAGRADLKIAKAGTPKAAFWLLSFDGDQLIQADPYPAPEV